MQGKFISPPGFPTSAIQQPGWSRRRGACQQRERHCKFLSYLTYALYVHSWCRGRCQFWQIQTHNAFLFPLYAMFRHDCLLAVKPASTSRRLLHKKLGEILYILICSFLLCLSWLLRSRVQKFWRYL
jgi:hypothetical protein